MQVGRGGTIVFSKQETLQARSAKAKTTESARKSAAPSQTFVVMLFSVLLFFFISFFCVPVRHAEKEVLYTWEFTVPLPEPLSMSS